MSDTDIYKNRERMPYGNKRPRRSTRRRSSDSQRAFDDHSRKRRSRNSGLRRLLHLYRKKENEKVVWWSVLACTLVLVFLAAIWQFWVRDLIMGVQGGGPAPYIQPHLEPREGPALLPE